MRIRESERYQFQETENGPVSRKYDYQAEQPPLLPFVENAVQHISDVTIMVLIGGSSSFAEYCADLNSRFMGSPFELLSVDIAMEIAPDKPAEDPSSVDTIRRISGDFCPRKIT